MTNDPSAKAIIENLKIPAEKAEDFLKFASSVVSIKVYAVKA
jgi:hypothetical protein